VKTCELRVVWFNAISAPRVVHEARHGLIEELRNADTSYTECDPPGYHESAEHRHLDGRTHMSKVLVQSVAASVLV